jgi:hypothetical protein
MAEIKATQFLMNYQDELTLNTDDSMAANPEDEASSQIEQVPEKQENNGKPESEEKAVTLNQLIRTEKGSEPVNETASKKRRSRRKLVSRT